MSLTYEVNLTVEAEIAQTYRAWLNEHILAMLHFDGFEGATLEQVIPAQMAASGATATHVDFSVRYFVRDQQCLEHYFAHHAPQMRAEGQQKFGNKFSAQRRILETKATFECAQPDNSQTP